MKKYQLMLPSFPPTGDHRKMWGLADHSDEKVSRYIYIYQAYPCDPIEWIRVQGNPITGEAIEIADEKQWAQACKDLEEHGDEGYVIPYDLKPEIAVEYDHAAFEEMKAAWFVLTQLFTVEMFFLQ